MSSAELVDVLVEIPKGSQNKFEWDKEIAVFFKAYKELEDKTVEVTGWGEVEEAISELNAARQRCVSKS